MRSRRYPRLSIILWIAAAVWCAALFLLSGQDGAESGALSLRFTRLVLRLFPGLPYSEAALEPLLRKCAHFAIFALEGMLLGGALMTCMRRRALGGLFAMLACALIAALNELHQTFSAGRSCELRDALIDSLGGIAGVLLAAAVLWLGLGFARRIARRRQML